jgi:hypothetical protein
MNLTYKKITTTTTTTTTTMRVFFLQVWLLGVLRRGVGGQQVTLDPTRTDPSPPVEKSLDSSSGSSSSHNDDAVMTASGTSDEPSSNTVEADSASTWEEEDSTRINTAEAVTNKSGDLAPTFYPAVPQEQQQQRQQQGTDESMVQDAAKEKDAPEEATNASVDNPATAQGGRRLWGAPSPMEDEPGGAKEAESARTRRTEDAVDPSVASHNHASHHNLHIPFMPKQQGAPTPHPPPEGFTITARVYIDAVDKLGHIDEEPLTLPYWDCGAVGSTTSPLVVKEAAFRHSLSPSKAWTGTDGKHPVLAIALSPFLLEVSSGETRTIQAGEAVLLEDVLIPGHKFKPLGHHDVKVLLLTLPQTHYITGKDKISISSYKKADPCPLPATNLEQPPGTLQQSVVEQARRVFRIRRVAFGIAGLSLSTLIADFLGKTAPLWLAVGVGGTFFVVAGTAGTILLGESAAVNLQAWLVHKRLRGKNDSSTPSGDDDTPEVSFDTSSD